MDNGKEKIKFPFKCPVCGKGEFENVDWLLEEDDDIEVYDIDPLTGEKTRSDAISAHGINCDYCGWVYDLKQVLDHSVVGDRNKKSIAELRLEYQEKIKENPNYNFIEEVAKAVPHKCPVCGEHDFKMIDSYDICPICGWIDDGTENIKSSDYSEVNVSSISDAQEAFKLKRQNDPNYKWKKEQK